MNVYVQFFGTAAPQATIGASAGAYGIDSLEAWRAAEVDVEWRAEQEEFLNLSAAADREAISEDEA